MVPGLEDRLSGSEEDIIHIADLVCYRYETYLVTLTVCKDTKRGLQCKIGRY
jgi:hypothetical protein